MGFSRQKHEEKWFGLINRFSYSPLYLPPLDHIQLIISQHFKTPTGNANSARERYREREVNLRCYIIAIYYSVYLIENFYVLIDRKFSNNGG